MIRWLKTLYDRLRQALEAAKYRPEKHYMRGRVSGMARTVPRDTP